MTKFSAPLNRWRHCLTDGAGEEIRAQLARFYGADEIESWCRHYDRALAEYADAYGDDAEVVISRCPAQMNIMGMHIDYGGMPSLRLAVKGADTITVAGDTTLAGTLEVEFIDSFMPICSPRPPTSCSAAGTPCPHIA